MTDGGQVRSSGPSSTNPRLMARPEHPFSLGELSGTGLTTPGNENRTIGNSMCRPRVTEGLRLLAKSEGALTAGFARRFELITLCCTALLVAGATVASAAVGAGRTDPLNGAPYYKSYRKTAPAGEVVTLPVRLDPGADDDFGDLGRPQSLRLLLDELNRHLATLEWARPLDVELADDGAPEVYVGSADGEHARPQRRWKWVVPTSGPR